MPLYEYECTDCKEVTESLEPVHMNAICCPHCEQGIAFRIMSTPHFRITGYSAKNGYNGVPSYDEVIDEHGYAKKKWGK